jgi:FkbM family methyltransferase
LEDRALPFGPEHSSDRLSVLRANYESGSIAKTEYNREIWKVHRQLFEYANFLHGTNIELIEIVEDGVIFGIRDPKLRLWCSPQDQRHVAIASLNFRQYESKELAAVLQLAKTCHVIFDIGANVGLYSIALAQRFPESKVISFEPIPATFQELRRNLELNLANNVVPYNLGLSDSSGNATFYLDPTVSGAASGMPLGPEFGTSNKVICSTETLDDFVDRTGHSPHLIKCDVEGAELHVFRGGARMIDRTKPMIFTEMLRKWSKRFGYHPNDIIAFFRQLGYECFVLSDGLLHPFMEMTEQTVETNFFFLHKEKHVETVRFLGLLK